MIAVGGLFYHSEKYLDDFFSMFLAQDYPKRKMRLIWLYSQDTDNDHGVLDRLKEFGEKHGHEYAEFLLFKVNHIPGDDDLGPKGKQINQENICKKYNHLVKFSRPDDLVIMEQDIIAPPNSITKLIQRKHEAEADRKDLSPIAAVAGLCLVSGGELKVDAKNGGIFKVCGLPSLSAYLFDKNKDFHMIAEQLVKVNSVRLPRTLMNKLMYVDGIATGLSLLTRAAMDKLPFEVSKGTQDLHFCKQARMAGFKIVCDTSLWYEHNHYIYTKIENELGITVTLLDSTKSDGITFEVVPPTAFKGGEKQIVNA